MAGPTPVSALIHAATMVTAGVYLIARTHVLFTLAPPVLFAVAVIGAATLLLAGFSALVQRDIKRVLAYSTISQIGYMFLALGVGAWSAALFHFMTHAFFKALLFLAAGVVILAQHHEHDMFKMGGLRRALPVTFWTFLIGASSLSALPFITAGFYSKDLILAHAWASPFGGPWFWAAGILGALVTTVYSFRMVFLVFFGGQKMQVAALPGRQMQLPLIVLAFFSLFAGFVELPPLFGDFRLFSQFLQTVLPPLAVPHERSTEFALLFATVAVQVFGIAAAYLFFLRSPGLTDRMHSRAPASALHAFWFSGWGFDRLYETLLVRPYLFAARISKNDVVDSWYSGIAGLNRFVHVMLSLTQTGNIRWYAAGLVLGALVFVGITLLLE
ncbi:MAG: hypothetical protein A2078_02515 [Nitrospirae bacterium GWC2_57_9]|nr:MAG: hypothetical protein A2078_02515 [Nitrospirae bacterium GWC2_57_9]